MSSSVVLSGDTLMFAAGLPKKYGGEGDHQVVAYRVEPATEPEGEE